MAKKTKKFNGKNYTLVGTTRFKDGLLNPSLAKETKKAYKDVMGAKVRTVKKGKKVQLYVRFD